MSEIMKVSTTKKSAEFRISVPIEKADDFEKAVQAMIRMMETKGGVADDEMEEKEYYTAEEVWGPARPGDILQGFRYREGLTQKQLADALSIKQSHISEMERGKRTITAAMAKRLADYFQTSPEVFLNPS